MKTKGIIFALSGLFFITGTLCSCDSDVDASNGDPMDGFATDGTSKLTPGGGGNNGDEPLNDDEKIFDRKNGNKEVKYDRVITQAVCEKIVEAIAANNSGTDYFVGEKAVLRWYGFDSDGDGITNKEELDQNLNPCDADSDKDGVIDGADPDPKNAGNFDEKEKSLRNELCKDKPVAETSSFGDSESGAAYVRLNGFEYAEVKAEPVDGMIAFDNGKVKADAPKEAIYALSISTKGKTKMWEAFLESFREAMPFKATPIDNQTLDVEKWEKIFGNKGSGYEESEEGVIRQGAKSLSFSIGKKDAVPDKEGVAQFYRDPQSMRNYLAQVIVELAKTPNPEAVKEIKELSLLGKNENFREVCNDGDSLTVTIRKQDYRPKEGASKNYINVTLAVACSSSMTQRTGANIPNLAELNKKAKENKKLFDEIVSGTLTNPANRYHKNAKTCEIVDPKTQGNQDIDFLWVIDNSSSMKDEQEGIYQIVEVFTKMLGETSIDYRLGVTTTDAYLLDEAPCTQMFYTEGNRDRASKLFTSIRGSSKAVENNTQNFADDSENYQKFGGPATVYSNIPMLDDMTAGPKYKLISQYCNVDMRTGLRSFHDLLAAPSNYQQYGLTLSSGFIVRGDDTSTSDALHKSRAFGQLIKTYGIADYFTKDMMGSNTHGYGIEDGLESAVITMKRLMKPYHEGENSPTKAEFDRINEGLKGKTSTENTYEMRKGALKYMIFVSDEENRIFKGATKSLSTPLRVVDQGIERKAGEANRDANTLFSDKEGKLEGNKASETCVYGPKYEYACDCPGFIFVKTTEQNEESVILEGVKKTGAENECELERHPEYAEKIEAIRALGLDPNADRKYLAPKCKVVKRKSLAGNNYFDDVYDELERGIGMELPEKTQPYACKIDTKGKITADLCAGHDDSLAFVTVGAADFGTFDENEFNKKARENSELVKKIYGKEDANKFAFDSEKLAEKQGMRSAVVAWYIDYLRKIAMTGTDGAGDITAAAIIGTPNCESLESNGTDGADADFSYTELAKGLSAVAPGPSAGICLKNEAGGGTTQEFTSIIRSIFDDAASRVASFPLKDYPIVSSIKVYVRDSNGKMFEVPSKPVSDSSPYWTYNPQFNSITLLNIGQKLSSADIVFHYAKWESKQA